MEAKPRLSPFYLFAVPLVILILVLYSGVPQKVLPAVTISGTSLTAAELNYAYYAAYNELVEQDAWLAETGFDPEVSEAKQNYDETTTWRTRFQALAKERAARVIYYTALARQAGYTYTGVEEQLAAKRAEIEAFCTGNNIKTANYFPAYFGTGMTETLFYEQYTLELQAAEYKAWLEQNRAVSAQQIDAYLADRQIADYTAANLCMIVLRAVPDRFTGVIGAEQIQWLSAKLDQLEKKYTAAPDAFASLSAAYAEEPVGENGVLADATRYVLPEEVADWLYGAQPPQPGAHLAVVSRVRGKAYLAVLAGWGQSGARLEAAQALRAAVTEEEELAALAGEYAPEEHQIGLYFVGT